VNAQGLTTPKENVQQLQEKLGHAAKENKKRRFHALYEYSTAVHKMVCEETATSEMDGIFSRSKAIGKTAWIEEALVICMPMKDEHRKAV
jgi:hypothetical protein